MNLQQLLKDAKASPPPVDVNPMLATLTDKPFDEPGWIYEVKWDGYRALIYLNNGTVEMRSRNNKSFNEKFYSLYETLKGWKINAVVDGEIIVLNEKGISNFSNLQSWRSEADGALVLYLFDVLWYDGNDVTMLPIETRKSLLQQLIPKSESIRLSESFNAGATEFFEVAMELKLEGIIAKKEGSVYNAGVRTRDWLKIKVAQRHEVIIGGYTKNEGSKKPFSSLLVGVFENDAFVYTGKIGTGFTNRIQEELMEKFKPIETNSCPFIVEPDINKPSRFRPNPPQASATWLKPEMVCEVAYAEMTSDGVMRHPSYQGLREDKNASDINNEPAMTPKKARKPKESLSKNVKEKHEKKASASIFKAPGDNERKTLLNPSEASQTRKINSHDLAFKNLNKIYYPAVAKNKAVTKRDVINYYYQVAPYILPYLKDRPQTLIRYPNGIKGNSFYQKDVTGKVPDWIKKFPYHSEAGGNRNFMVVTNEASLLYIVSIGGLEIHPWSSRVAKPDNPDWCILDLDPDKNPFTEVITAAQKIKEVLDAIEVPSFCKTSGSTGMHIYIPLGAKYTYEQSKEFGRVLVKIVHDMIPEFTSIERLTDKRKGCIYLDFLQNRPQATLAAPYSLRPKPGATVSMPLHWEEVTKKLKMEDFNIFNAAARVKEQGDIFSGVLGKGIQLKPTIKKIQSVFGEQPLHKSLR